ncbi:MAG TPA: hypothetical protein VF043_32495 [Ktedonobacteraceae bacterium]
MLERPTTHQAAREPGAECGSLRVRLSPDDLQRLEAVAPKGAWLGARYATVGHGMYGTSRVRS